MMAVEYPGMARLAMAHIPVGDNSLRVIESMLSLLKAGGVSDQAAAYAADLIWSYTTRDRLRAEPLRRALQRPRARGARGRAHRRALRRPLARALPDDRRAARADDHRRRRGALLARPRRDRQRPARRRRPRAGSPACAWEQQLMSERWFVVNVRDADWESKGEFGVRTPLRIARRPLPALRHHRPGHRSPASPAASTTPRRPRRGSSSSPASAWR